MIDDCDPPANHIVLSDHQIQQPQNKNLENGAHSQVLNSFLSSNDKTDETFEPEDVKLPKTKQEGSTTNQTLETNKSTKSDDVLNSPEKPSELSPIMEPEKISSQVDHPLNQVPNDGPAVQLSESLDDALVSVLTQHQHEDLTLIANSVSEKIEKVVSWTIVSEDHNIVLSHDELNSKSNKSDDKFITIDSENLPEVQKRKAREMLLELRKMVANTSHDYRSKFENIGFTKVAKISLDAFYTAWVKPISIKEQPEISNSMTELDFGFRQSHIDNANADKNQGLSPKMFIKKMVNGSNSTKAKNFRKQVSMPDLKSKNMVWIYIYEF